MQINKEHDYLICIDSDGTVMDTMTSKHKLALGPCFIKTFGIKDEDGSVLDKWLSVNCFSLTRGYNRFLALSIMLRYVEKLGYTYDGVEEYHMWANTTNSLSTSSLLEKIKEVKNTHTLELAYNWAIMANEEIAKMNEAVSFDNACQKIHLIKNYADLVGVSTANNKALTREWTNAGIIDEFKLVASQEYGTKEVVISSVLECGYLKEKTIMIGDSFGDLDAAKKCGVWFFPIIPNSENESWNKFYNETLPKLLNNSFDLDYQNSLIGSFINALK